MKIRYLCQCLLTMIVLAITYIGLTALPVQAASPPSAFDFMKPSSFSKVELSPSGRYVAFIRVQTDKYCINKYGAMVKGEKLWCKQKKKSYRSTHQIAIFDLDTSKIIKIFPLPENYLVSWLEWASDERFLAAIYIPNTRGGRSYGAVSGGSRVLSLHINSTDYVALFSNQTIIHRQNKNLTRITNMLRQDPDHVIIPARKGGELDLWKVNILSGDAEKIAEGKRGTFHYFTDKAGKPILRFDCVGRWCFKVKVFAFDNAEEGWKNIKTFEILPDEDEEDYDFWPIAAAPISGQFYVISDEGERRSVKLYDIKTEKFIKTVFDHPQVDVGGVVLDLQTGVYAGAWYYEDRLGYSFENPKLQQYYNGLNKYFGNKENVALLGFNADGSKAVVYVTSPNNPGEYHVYNMKSQQVMRLFGRRDHMDERLASSADILQIPTRDGKTVTAYHIYPTGKKSAKTPLLVMPHGGPERRDYYDYDTTVQYFVTRGYQVLQVNFRGSSGFGRAFAEAGYGEWGGVMQDDVIDAVKYLYNKSLASADNTCIVGYSYGGYVALYAGANTPEMFKCIVSGGGVTDILADLKQTKLVFGKESETYEYWLDSMGDPKLDKEKLKAASPVNMAAKFTAPVLLVHGEKDGIVKISQSVKMRKALKKAGKEVEFFRLEDARHAKWRLEQKILYHETIEKFLDKHLTKP